MKILTTRKLKMSLKVQLNQIIKDRNGEIFTYNELKLYCEKSGFKLSNGERRLRASESPNIERLMKHGAIIGYRYLESGPDVKQWFKAPKTPNLASGCCPGFPIFKVHNQNCPILEVMESQAKVLVDHRQYELGLIKK